jgi:hypothetical protein
LLSKGWHLKAASSCVIATETAYAPVSGRACAHLVV